ncbi:hypothetical protein PF011_g4858 [Phytophthora fragariae]|uniref:Ubiquitin-like protease family profile domain-containing protein n=1 Tax=Phytophthora fragariae TaxID=53985 RepID=A0A6A3LU17_9STRA|nr:hypothetical protein PF011_g4858 [Phytophthora fragariae]
MRLRSRVVSARTPSSFAPPPRPLHFESNKIPATSPMQSDFASDAASLDVSMQRQCRRALRTPRGARKRRMDEDVDGAKRRRLRLLQAAFGPEDRVDESNWLTGALMDLMLWKFATSYPAVHFLPTAFFHLHLEAADRSPWRRRCRALQYQVKDVLGRPVDYESDASLVFIVNVDRIHWNLFRVQLGETPKLQLFEPMGRLASRSGISYRSVPRAVIEWLDVCYPQHKGWMQRTVSAITNKQQVSGFDCGVACLLYADKCGRGQTGEQINAQIDQEAITAFRKELPRQLHSIGDGIDG